MKLSTMAAVMTFVSKLENETATFYETHAEVYPELKNDFLAWSKENRKFEKQVKQTYFGVITDTLESNFSFEGLDTEDFHLNTSLEDGADVSATRQKALRLEETIRDFYIRSAQSCEGLMADIPRLFKKIARKREDRLVHLG